MSEKFSTDICPICHDKLELNVIELHNLKERNEVAFRYYCNRKELVRSEDDMKCVSKSHYSYHILDNGGMVTMIYPPYQLEHSRYHKTTKVFAVCSRKPKKLIFECPSLDAVWAQPYNVLSKLRVLATFS
jgi:hypothetical protein